MHVERVEAGAACPRGVARPHQALAAVAWPWHALSLLVAVARHLSVPAIAGAFSRTHLLRTVARPVSVAAVAPATVSLGVARPVARVSLASPISPVAFDRCFPSTYRQDRLDKVDVVEDNWREAGRLQRLPTVISSSDLFAFIYTHNCPH